MGIGSYARAAIPMLIQKTTFLEQKKSNRRMIYHQAFISMEAISANNTFFMLLQELTI